jgi:hypothetical protein
MTDPDDMGWLDAACLYRLRIEEECFRLNTVSPRPPKHIWDHTSALGRRLGRTTWLAMMIPTRLAWRRARSA